jgi:hypothetical protein
MAQKRMESSSGKQKSALRNVESRPIPFKTNDMLRLPEVASFPRPGVPVSSGRTTKESKEVIGRMLTRLFYQESGALYVVNPSHGSLEIAAIWGSHESEEQALALKIGKSLIENRIHLGDKAYIPMIAPKGMRPDGQTCLCVPMHSHRGMLGLLYARFKREQPSLNTFMHESIVEQKRRFAVAAAETLALVLAGVPGIS